MEGAMILMLLTGFLAFIVYRMDQNDRKSEHPAEDISDAEAWYKKGFEDACREMMDRQHDGTPTKAIRKKRR